MRNLPASLVNDLRDAAGIARCADTDDTASYDKVCRAARKADLVRLLWASAGLNSLLLRKAAGDYRPPVTEAAWRSLLDEITSFEDNGVTS